MSESSASRLADSDTQVLTFQDTFDNFLNFAEKVLQYDTTGEFKLSVTGSQSNGVQVALNGYREVFNNTRNSAKHLDKFREVYQKCRPYFLKGLSLDEFMEWFSDSSFVIAPTDKSRRKIYLTIIFRNCVRIASRVADEVTRHPEKEEELLNNPAAVYPEQFMLYLFRMFYHCADETDRQTMINKYISELEKTLNLGQNENPVSTDGLSEIMSAAREMAAGIGIDMPKESPKISSSQFKEVLRQFTKNDELKKGLKSAFEGININDPKEIPNAIGRLLNKMSQAASTPPEAVQRSMNATADNQVASSSK
jgi:Asp-tRNA(Asn)/Glu-tRNA(Gln) amidotransferase C subunit